MAIHKKIGSINIELGIKKDNTIQGKIGEAQLVCTSVIEARYGFEIKGKLDA